MIAPRFWMIFVLAALGAAVLFPVLLRIGRYSARPWSGVAGPSTYWAVAVSVISAISIEWTVGAVLWSSVFGALAGVGVARSVAEYLHARGAVSVSMPRETVRFDARRSGAYPPVLWHERTRQGRFMYFFSDQRRAARVWRWVAAYALLAQCILTYVVVWRAASSATEVAEHAENAQWKAFAQRSPANAFVAEHYRPCIEAVVYINTGSSYKSQTMSPVKASTELSCRASAVTVATAQGGQQAGSDVAKAIDAWDHRDQSLSAADQKVVDDAMSEIIGR